MIKTKKYRVSSKRKSLYKLTYTIYDFYQNYDEKNKIPKEKYIAVLKDFFATVAKKVIVDRKQVEFPHALGTHRIQKVKQNMSKTPRIDFNKSKIYGTRIYHLNNHSSGFYFKWRWNKYPSVVKNKKMYIFELTKKNALLLAKEIFRCNSDPYIKDYDALR
jgi:hypothetical protein